MALYAMAGFHKARRSGVVSIHPFKDCCTPRVTEIGDSIFVSVLMCSIIRSTDLVVRSIESSNRPVHSPAIRYSSNRSSNMFHRESTE